MSHGRSWPRSFAGSCPPSVLRPLASAHLLRRPPPAARCRVWLALGSCPSPLESSPAHRTHERLSVVHQPTLPGARRSLEVGARVGVARGERYGDRLEKTHSERAPASYGLGGGVVLKDLRG